MFRSHLALLAVSSGFSHWVSYRPLPLRSDATIGPHRRFLKLQLPPLFRTVWAPARTPTRAPRSASHRCTGRRYSARHRRSSRPSSTPARGSTRATGTASHRCTGRRKSARHRRSSRPSSTSARTPTRATGTASHRCTGRRHAARHRRSSRHSSTPARTSTRAPGTASHRCTWRRQSAVTPEVVTALVNAGADPNARDGDGRTPFELIPEDSPLKGTDVYWRLNEARFR